MKNRCQHSQKTANKKRLYGIEAGPQPEAMMLPLLIPEIIVDTRAEIEEMAGMMGLLIIKQCIQAEVQKLVGDRYQRAEGRRYTRWGQQPGAVVFAGRKVRIEKPRVRDLTTFREAALSSYEKFRNEDKLGKAMTHQLLLGISARNYHRSVENFCDGYGIQRSSVSRSFIRATAHRLKKLMERSFDGMTFVTIMIDGIEYHGQMIVVAIGITMDGKKHVLGIRLGATENAVVVTALLEDLVERGIDATRPMLFVLDGAKALTKAVKNLWGERAVIQRCQVHKLRNIRAHLPEKYHAEILGRIRGAYAMESFETAKASLTTTVRYLERIAPDAAGSLEEGLEETLTVHRLGVRGLLRKTLASTNAIENCQGTTRRITHNVKRWRDGAMIMRWAGSALLVAEERFHRIRGYRDLVFLKSALQKLVSAVQDNAVDSSAMVA